MGIPMMRGGGEMFMRGKKSGVDKYSRVQKVVGGWDKAGCVCRGEQSREDGRVEGRDGGAISAGTSR